VSKEVNPAVVDIRTRERNLAKGLGTKEQVETLLASLPDLESEAESVSIPQPAIGGRED
jgi:hypothetical protein